MVHFIFAQIIITKSVRFSIIISKVVTDARRLDRFEIFANRLLMQAQLVDPQVLSMVFHEFDLLNVRFFILTLNRNLKHF